MPALGVGHPDQMRVQRNSRSICRSAAMSNRGDVSRSGYRPGGSRSSRRCSARWQCAPVGMMIPAIRKLAASRVHVEMGARQVRACCAGHRKRVNTKDRGSAMSWEKDETGITFYCDTPDCKSVLICPSTARRRHPPGTDSFHALPMPRNTWGGCRSSASGRPWDYFCKNCAQDAATARRRYNEQENERERIKARNANSY